MTRLALRRPSILALAGLGWALLVLIWLPVILDLLPIRVVIGDVILLDTGGCVIRESARGLVHTPDSPHWAQTGTSRCLDQE